MTNYEKFKDKIIEIISCGLDGGLAVRNNKPELCCMLNCDECDWGPKTTRLCVEGDYEAKVKEWLNAEYTEQPKLTKQEMAFLVALDPSFQYVARDKKGHLSFFRIKPEKNLFLEKWDVPNQKCEEQRLFYPVPTCLSFMEEQRLFSFRFDFIIWEDDEPWSVKNLLRLEVIDDDS